MIYVDQMGGSNSSASTRHKKIDFVPGYFKQTSQIAITARTQKSHFAALMAA
jgi:hypothetical protein